MKNQHHGESIWIDLDNSPHVLFFHPVIQELNKRGYKVVITARKFAQVCSLAELYHLDYRQVGRHYGKNKVMKAAGVVIRALEMLPILHKEKPVLAFSHGSRSQVLAAKFAGIPTLEAFDYEYAKGLPMLYPTRALVPEVVQVQKIYANAIPVSKYPGIKEDVYIQDFEPDSTVLQTLGIAAGEIVATIRPPATHAHYHNAESEPIFEEVVEFLCADEKTRLIMLPRIAKQDSDIRHKWQHHFESGKIIIPPQVVNGLNLIWQSDLVISGGGTMIREAAALGVPAYSFFRGKTGAVDRYLADAGRLVLLQNAGEVRRKIRVQPRHRIARVKRANNKVLQAIIDEVVKMIESET